MIKFLVIRPKDTVIVGLMRNKKSGKYSYVNFTKEHICPCKFNTINEAISDMENQKKIGNIIQYINF